MPCAGYAPFTVSPAQDEILDAIIARPRPGESVVLDLDGCLFDNRARQIHIFQEFGARRGLPQLYAVREEHFRDWSLARTLKTAGIDPALVDEIDADLRKYWAERFFTSAYVDYDYPMPGAVRLVRAMHERGARIVYLTGRDDTMHEGSVHSLRRFGFPAPGADATLLTKPDAATPDDEWKEEAMHRIQTIGTPAVFLDNEPINVNKFRRAFPDALVVFVSTDHSFLPHEPDPDLPQVRGFLRTTDQMPAN